MNIFEELLEIRRQRAINADPSVEIKLTSDQEVELRDYCRTVDEKSRIDDWVVGLEETVFKHRMFLGLKF